MKKIDLNEPQSKEDHVYRHVRMPRPGHHTLGTGDSLPWLQIFKVDLAGISTTKNSGQKPAACR